MEDQNKQTGYDINQIEAEKPAVKRSFNLFTGNIAGTLNGGHERTIMYREVMADERIAAEGANLFIATLTPKTASWQRLKAVVRVYKVPYERVWKNYSKFAAQNGGSSEIKIQEMPNLAGKFLPLCASDDSTAFVAYQETTAFRDSFISDYIPRMGCGVTSEAGSPNTPWRKVPAMQALALRGSVAIFNDMQRNKQYTPAVTEYINNDTVTDAEWNSYIMQDTREMDYYTRRARRDTSYYTNYRTELQGFESGWPPDDLNSDTALINYVQWENSVAEARSQAEAAEWNSWDYMQKLRGAKKLTQGRVEKLAEKTFPLAYSSITQNAYNNNPDIEEKFRAMGFQGGYSFTNIDLVWLNGIKMEEDGMIHVTLTITADTVFESAVSRKMLNINWQDRYRPDLEVQKNDVLYKIEMGTPFLWNETNYDLNQAVGFKRKYSEYFMLDNQIKQEMTNRGFIQTDYNENGNCKVWSNLNRIIPNNTYHFFEMSAEFEYDVRNEYGISEKKIWLDYTDLMINKNLAYQAPVYNLYDQYDEGGISVGGPNQIFYYGETYVITDLPISEEIKNNYTKWGEH